MDGPVIEEAVHRALAGGTHVADVLRTVEAVARTGVAVLVMTYWNPVDHYGVAAFARDLAAAGGSGLITPDLTPEEAGPWLAAAAQTGLDPVFLVAPSSSRQRIELITSVCGGFVYAASLMGITGDQGRGRRPGRRAGPAGQGVHEPAGRRRPRAFPAAPRRPRWRASPTGSSSGRLSWPGCCGRRTSGAGLELVRDLATDLAAGVRSRQSGR